MPKSIKVDQKRQRGRPATGRDPVVSVRVPEQTLSELDDWAEKRGVGRAEAIRTLLEDGLRCYDLAKGKRRR